MNAPKYIKHFLPAVLFFAAQAFVSGQTIITLTYDSANANAPYYWTLPLPADAMAEGKLWGAGGGGGGFYVNYVGGNGNFGAAAAGGGGGEYNFVTNISGTLNIEVGRAGAGGLSTSSTSANRGGAGGNSSITAGGITTSAFGGTGGMGITVIVNSPFIYDAAKAAGDNGQGGQGGSSVPSNWGTNGALGDATNSGGNRWVTPGYGGGAGNGGSNANTNNHIGLNHGVGSFAEYPSETALVLDDDPSIPGGGAPGAWKISNQATVGTIFSLNGANGGHGRVQITFSVDILVPAFSGPTSACAGDVIVFSIENPVPGARYYLERRGTVESNTRVFSRNLDDSYTYSYTVPTTGSGDYYVRATYDFKEIAEGVTDVYPNLLTSRSEEEDDITLEVFSGGSGMPKIYWSYNAICPIDESFDNEIWQWTDGTLTYPGDGTAFPPSGCAGCFPDTTYAGNYFANFIHWDSIVYVPGVDDYAGDLIWWDASAGGNILKENGVLTQAGIDRQALGKFLDFWQDRPYGPDTAWVSIAGSEGGFCASRLMVLVHITDDETFQFPPICETYYTKEIGDIAWSDALVNAHIYVPGESYEEFVWFDDFEKAHDYYNGDDRINYMGYPGDPVEPDPVDLTIPSIDSSGETYWAIRQEMEGDDVICMSRPIEINITMVERPDVRLWINEIGNDEATFCRGEEYDLIIQFTAGTPPYILNGIGFDLPNPITAGDLTDDTLHIRMNATSLYFPPLPLSYGVESLTDANAHLSCLVADPPGYIHPYQNAQVYVFAPPVITDKSIASLSPICVDDSITFPDPPVLINYNSAEYTTGWILDSDTIKTRPYFPTLEASEYEKEFVLKYFVENSCGFDNSNSVTVKVSKRPDEIEITSNTICSGDSIEIQNFDADMIYTSDNTDVTISDAYIKTNEVMDGPVTVTITVAPSAGGCSSSTEITVTPRTQTPTFLRWNFDEVCPIDESEGTTYTVGDSTNILTPWNSGGVYFANHIIWDSLVVNSIGEDILLKEIKWYHDEEMTQFIRQGWDPDYDSETRPPAAGSGEPMANFWQNEPHHDGPYWATITVGDSCESRPFRIEVLILDDPGEIAIDTLAGYVQPSGTLNYESYFNLGLDNTQFLEWFSTKTDAEEGTNQLPTPEELDLTIPIDITYWLVKADDFGCRSLPTPFRVHLFPMPEIRFEPEDTLVCPGGAATIRVIITGGTAPFNFEITNSSTSDVISESDYNDNIFSFPINPFNYVEYYISQFSDKYTDSVTVGSLGLFPPAAYEPDFHIANISVMTAEIWKITPNEGPVSGGTFTGNSSDPIDPDGTVTIEGYGFDGVISVMFGDHPATHVTVLNSYTITCTPPFNPSGYVTVSVITDCGTFSYPNGYLYKSSDITDVSPAYAPVTGGTEVTIQGSGFLATGDENDITVTLCGEPAIVISVADDGIVCIAGPSNYARHGSIEIYNGSETNTFPNRFTYYPVHFIRNGNWSDHTNWDKHTNDSIIPYPNAKVHIMANCLQDINLMGAVDEMAATFPYNQGMDSITVYPGKAYTIGSGRTLDANVFTLKDDASFLNFGTMEAVEQNVEHLLTKGRNWYVSNPLTTPGSFTGNIDRVEWYDETSNLWVNSNTAMDAGQGYTVFHPDNDIALKFSGIYNDFATPVQHSLTRTPGNVEYSGFNLVGNPFPSYWRWTATAASAANVYSTIWYRTVTGGVYEFWSYNASGDIAVMPGWEDDTPTGSYSLGYVPPIQAFWVRILDGQTSGILTFTNNSRAHADHGSNVLKSSAVENTETRSLLRITVNNGVRADETVIYADAKAKKEFDTYDSDKWFINQGAEIFTLPVSSTRELVINGLPEITDGTEITLGFQAKEGGAFSFRAKEILNLDTLNVFLSDKWRNTEFDLRSGDYNFTSGSAPTVDRFSIIFRSPANSDDLSVEDNLLAYGDKNGQITIILHLRDQQGSNANVSVFDLAGRRLAEQSVVVGDRTTLKGAFPKGVYILRSGKCVAKVIVRR